jgi:adenylate cyclase
MGMEIERKFLVRGDGWRTVGPAPGGVRLTQGYLNRDPARTVRVRVAGEKAFLTIKGLTHGASRLEFEYPISVVDAQDLLALCDGPLIDKTRHTLTLLAGQPTAPSGQVVAGVWEVDEFHGDNAGLVVAEIELASEHQPFHRPDWLGEEVTHDARYYNSALAVRPYRSWFTV